jgi:oligosaccharide 4-alpha-D-glucosyltransferase
MRLRFTLLSLLFCTTSLIAQTKTAYDPYAKGTWRFDYFGNKILKGQFEPEGYRKNEQASNAVIQKAQQPIGQSPIQIKIIDGALETVALKNIDSSFDIIGYTAKDGYQTVSFSIGNNTQFFGAGERSLPMNRRGYRLPLYNNPWYGYSTNADALNYSIPFVISNEGYGIFFDNPSVGYIDIGKTNSNVLEFGFKSGELSFYIIVGNSIEEISKNYYILTGKQPLPPRWALGNFMSRFGYSSQQQLDSIYQAMKTAGYPMDAVIIDLFWFGDSIKGTLGNLDWMNKTAWPNPANMIAQLKKDSVNTVLITEPFVIETTHNYEKSKQYHATDSTGSPGMIPEFYFGNTGLIDVFRNDAKAWFWSQYKKQIDIGVGGWWGDLGEPEKHPNRLFHDLKDLGLTKRLFNAEDVHNIYGHYWSKLLFEQYAIHYPSTRLFHLNRSGYAGTCRYSIFPWSGDVSRSWDGFRAQLPVMLGASISGIPYISADAGGFAGGEKDPELYTRWLQFAAFTPVFRPHGTALGNIDPNAAHIESEPVFWDAATQTRVKALIQERYALLPYNYSLSYQHLQTGKALVRPMFYDDLLDNNLLQATEQFYWGDYFLIAPVLEKGAKTKKIYLPKGEWFDWRQRNRKINGGQWLEEPVTLDAMPVFVKAGSIVPTISSINNTMAYANAKLMFTYFPAAQKTTYTLFEDDGAHAGNIANKQFGLIECSGINNPKAKTISLLFLQKGKAIKANRSIAFNIALPGTNVDFVMINGKKINAGNANGANWSVVDGVLQLNNYNWPTAKALQVMVKYK